MGTKVDATPLRQFGFPPASVGDADLERWMSEGFIFSAKREYKSPPNRDAGGSKMPILQQGAGGPCGVIAAVQGHVLCELLFEKKYDTQGEKGKLLAAALGGILWRSRKAEDDCCGISVCVGNVKEDMVEEYVITTGEKAVVEFLAENISGYRKQGGIMLFMYSLILTRSIDKLRTDMDDSTQGLTGQFGHCTQELMNLLLSGVASSQVHDGVVDLGGGMTLRGVPRRPLVGYLSHLEALRYCQVGTYYKKPKYPIWVVGSDSHYTTLTSAKHKTLNEESLREKQFNKAKRAFNEMDSQENGFVAIEKVSQILRKLELPMTDEEIAGFIGQCEMPGSGIILWNNFWIAVKPKLVPKLDWSCPACTFINDKSNAKCDMCMKERTDDMIVDDGTEEVDDGPHTFDFTHINGLVSTKQGEKQGPTVTDFCLTKVSKDLAAPSTHGAGIAMEETLHTRFPGSVFLWPNDQPPNING